MKKLIDEITTCIAAEDGATATSVARIGAYRHVLALLKKSDDGLQTFFYLLLRDKLPASDVERLVGDSASTIGRITSYSNAFLAGYAAELRARVLGLM